MTYTLYYKVYCDFYEAQQVWVVNFSRVPAYKWLICTLKLITCAHEWQFISLNCLICYFKWLCSLELIICLHKLTDDRTFVIFENMGKQIVIVWGHRRHLLSGENNEKGNVPKCIHFYQKVSKQCNCLCSIFSLLMITKHSPLFERYFGAFWAAKPWGEFQAQTPNVLIRVFCEYTD